MKPKMKVKKGPGRGKMQGPSKNRKKGVAPKSVNQNTMTPSDAPNRADADLGNLLNS